MIGPDEIRRAAELLAGRIIRTPLVHSPAFSRMFGADVYLKMENLQKTGSFKIRGASYKLETCKDRIGPEGVVAASAGNHAQGVALAATQAGVPAAIVMPEWASISKQEATRSYGGAVEIHGRSLGESLKHAQTLSESGRMFIHPFDDPDIITGQGTIGLEIIQELKDADLIVVPVGGGGLIAGVAAAVKPENPKTKVIGVQAALCPSAATSLKTGKITEVTAGTSIADGITVKQTGFENFDIIRRFVDDVVLVEEEDIAEAVLILLERKKILAEGAGAVALAALLNGAVRIPKGKNAVLVISGGNMDSPLLGRVISRGLVKRGRIMRLRVRLTDAPGNLAAFLARTADMGANVLHIYHDRHVKDLPINVTCVELELETRSRDHIRDILLGLERGGYAVELR